MDKYKSSRKKKRRGFYGTKKPSQDLEVEGNTATASAESQQATTTTSQETITQSKRINNTLPNQEINEVTTVSVMHKKQQHKQAFSPVKCQTRKRKRESLLLSPDVVTPINGSGYKIIESKQFQSLISASCCTLCKIDGTLEIRQNNKKRKRNVRDNNLIL